MLDRCSFVPEWRSTLWSVTDNETEWLIASLEIKREYHHNCSVLDCVTQCSQSAAHLYEQFFRSNRFGSSHWDPYTMCRCSSLELYYCNMVEWFWWDSSLISTTNWFLSVLWPVNYLWCVEWACTQLLLASLSLRCSNGMYVIVVMIACLQLSEYVL